MKSQIHKGFKLRAKSSGKTIFPLALIVLFAVSCKKKIKEPDVVERFCIESSKTHGTYDINVALPDGYNNQHKKYGTVYVLDCKDNFNIVAYQCKELSKKYAKENTLVVGIGYGNDRSFDYTPTKADQGGGGAGQFLQFIQKELIPRLENDYGADTTRESRVILGHSFGGLFGTYAFSKANKVFGNYILLSPSIWYDNEVVLEYESENRSYIKNDPGIVFLGIGQLENSGRMQAPFEALYRILDQTYPNVKLMKHSVPEMEHVGSRNQNIVKGLDFYFQNK
ncbi:MAG: alpha/beta hydrolase [Bacteroidia bacterium]|nr:alpha/beta hydrolase [Bacteroidia bacterium]